MVRVHLGNATIYLTPSVLTDPDGWLNVDMPGSGSRPASECPEGVAKWATTENAYYARLDPNVLQIISSGGRPDHELMVCDAFGTWADIPVKDGQASELLSVQCFEHLSISEAHIALVEANRVLCKGGLLRLDVPDMDETLRVYRETGSDLFKRHILGSRKNQYSYHCIGWTREGLIGCCERFGFEYVCEEPVPVGRFVPSFCLRFRKVSP